MTTSGEGTRTKLGVIRSGVGAGWCGVRAGTFLLAPVARRTSGNRRRPQGWCRPGGRPTCDQPLPRIDTCRQRAPNAAGRVPVHVAAAALAGLLDRGVEPWG